MTGRENPFSGVVSISDFLRVWLEKELLSPDEERSLHAYYRNFRKLRSARLRHLYTEQIREPMDHLVRNPTARVLEVGTGCGTEALWLAVNGADVTSIDVQPDYVALARRRQEVLEAALGRTLSCRFECASILEMGDAAPFDLIWMEQALHHLEPREDCANMIARLVRPGGKLFISEANGLNPLVQLQLLKVRGTQTVIVAYRHDGREFLYGNERVLSSFNLRRLFARRGIVCEKVRYFRLFPSNPIFDRFAWLDRNVSTKWLLPLHTHYNYVGTKTAPE